MQITCTHVGRMSRLMYVRKLHLHKYVIKCMAEVLIGANFRLSGQKAYIIIFFHGLISYARAARSHPSSSFIVLHDNRFVDLFLSRFGSKD